MQIHNEQQFRIEGTNLKEILRLAPLPNKTILNYCAYDSPFKKTSSLYNAAIIYQINNG